MHLDITFPTNDMVEITYEISLLKEDSDYATALAIMSCFCAEFELEPELGLEDFKQLVNQIQAEGASKFCVSIDEEGIELDPIKM